MVVAVVVAQACLGKPLVVLAALGVLVLMAVPVQDLAVELLAVVKMAVLMEAVAVVAVRLYIPAAPIHILLPVQALVVQSVLSGVFVAFAAHRPSHQPMWGHK